MFDEDQDTLAAEYVLGTLSAEEREHAEALRSFDPGFEAAVRQWERRLGELNVMVEAVEPPPQVWEKITAEVTTPAAAGETASPRDLDEPSSATALASDFVIIESTAAPIPQAETAAETPDQIAEAQLLASEWKPK